ncbi:MAG: transcriptional regulator, partial [Leptospiraceae bacterium]|nr:transcriptional regulator [Leptospiraceae bacterium]
VIDEDGKLIGLVSKEKISHEMADLESEGKEYEQIPETFYDYSLNEKILQYFNLYKTIPVLNLEAQRVLTWDKSQFLTEVAKLKKPEPIKEEPPTPKAQEIDSRLIIYQFMELILKSFPDPLFATDKEGKTTFYNEKFELDVLSKEFFQDSIANAEKYFRELNRDLISDYIRTHEINGERLELPCLQIYIPAIEMFVRLTTLRANTKVIGYLYHFLNPKLAFLNEKGEKSFPILEELYGMNTPLNDVLKIVESAYILRAYKQNHENISHTANYLQLPRSTLQNRIKFLNIQEILGRDSSTAQTSEEPKEELEKTENEEQAKEILPPPPKVTKKKKKKAKSKEKKQNKRRK